MNMSSAALEYLKEGKPVFPVGPDKKPLVPWKPYQSRLPSKEEVVKWWKLWPDANIGMATGRLSGVIVIDADRQESASRLADEYPEARQTRCVKTGRGWHIYFQYQEGIRNSAGKFAPGLDIRGEGGYVLLPPSKHETGAVYQWMNSNILPLPEALAEKFLNGDPVYKGQRNDVLFRYGAGLRSKGFEEEAILTSLTSENERRCKPPLPEREIHAILKSVIKYPPGTKFEEMQPTQLIVYTDIPKEQEGERFAWDGLIKFGSAHLLASKPEVGKTTWAINLALAIKRGVPYLGIPTTQSSVLYCYFDKGGNKADLAEAYEIFEIEAGEVPYISQVLAPDSINIVIEAIKFHAAKFVVIDTLGDTLRTRFKLQGTLYNIARDLAQPLTDYAAQHGVALLLLTHLRKETLIKSSDPFDEIIDSTGYRGMVWKSFLYTLMPDSEVRMFQSSTGRGRWFKPTWIDFDLNGWLCCKGDQNTTAHHLLRLKILDAIKGDQPTTWKKVCSRIGYYNTSTFRTFKELLSEGAIVKTGLGRRGDPFLYSLYTKNLKTITPEEGEGDGKKPITIAEGEKAIVKSFKTIFGDGKIIIRDGNKPLPGEASNWREELDKKWRNFGK